MTASLLLLLQCSGVEGWDLSTSESVVRLSCERCCEGERAALSETSRG